MNVGLSIDQALDNVCGFAALDLEANRVLGTWRLTYENIPHYDTRRRCIRFAAVLQKLMAEVQPAFVVTEMVRRFHANAILTDTIMALSEIHGVMKVIVKPPTPIYFLNTASWQRETFRPGKRDDVKKLSVCFVHEHYRLDVSHHEADALCMIVAWPRLKDNTNQNICRVLR